MEYEIARIIVEAISAVICFILAWFMIKPYRLTRQTRYLGLPLGFSILGLSFALTVILWSPPLLYHNAALSWLAHLTRVFAFVFIAVTYLFSKKPSKKSRILWDLTLSLLIILLIALSLVLTLSPQYALVYYGTAVTCIRSLSLICLFYIIVYTLRKYKAKPGPAKIWIPVGFVFLAASQVLLLVLNFYPELASIWGWVSLALRLVGLAVFLAVAYQTFYSKEENEIHEKDPAQG